MRVHVREFLHGSTDRDGLFGLEHRRGVVSKRNHWSRQNERNANSRTQLIHREGPIGAVSTHRLREYQ
jgi:hypothetical protein